MSVKAVFAAMMFALAVLYGGFGAEAGEKMHHRVIPQMKMASCLHRAGDVHSRHHKSSEDGCCLGSACCLQCLPFAVSETASVPILTHVGQDHPPGRVRVLKGRIVPPPLGPPRV